MQVKAAMYDPVTQEWQHLDPKRAGFTSNIVYTITHTKMGRSINENKKRKYTGTVKLVLRDYAFNIHIYQALWTIK